MARGKKDVLVHLSLLATARGPLEAVSLARSSVLSKDGVKDVRTSTRLWCVVTGTLFSGIGHVVGPFFTEQDAYAYANGGGEAVPLSLTAPTVNEKEEAAHA